MKHLLICFHAPSENLQSMVSAMEAALGAYEFNNLSFSIQSPLQTTVQDVLTCDGIILGTPENLAYMSGALKDFFDRIYYPCLEEKQGLPVAAIVRAGQDGTGTQRALKTILTGLKWRWVQDILLCKGPWQPEFTEQCAELAQAMAVALDEGMI